MCFWCGLLSWMLCKVFGLKLFLQEIIVYWVWKFNPSFLRMRLKWGLRDVIALSKWKDSRRFVENLKVFTFTHSNKFKRWICCIVENFRVLVSHLFPTKPTSVQSEQSIRKQFKKKFIEKSASKYRFSTRYCKHSHERAFFNISQIIYEIGG